MDNTAKVPFHLTESKAVRLTLLSTIAVSVAIVALTLLIPDHMWGVSSFRFFNWPVRFSAILTPAFFTIGTVIILRYIPDLGASGEVSRSWSLAFGLFALAIVVLFFMAPSVTTFLGDGHLRTNQIRFGEWFLWSEPLDFSLHALLYKHVLQPLGSEPITTYRLLSPVAGILYLVGVWRLALVIDGQKRFLLSLILISSGCLVLFFGYVESYSFVVASFPFVIAEGILFVRHENSSRRFFIAFLISSLLHPIALFLFAPVVLFVAFQRQTTKSDASSFRLFAQISFLVVSVYSIMSILSASGVDPLTRYILPLFSTGESQASVSSLRTLSNILNWTILSTLAGLPLILIACLRGNNEQFSTLQRCAVLLILSSSCFALFFRPQLTGPRDWDLFATALFPILPSVLVLAHRQITLRVVIALAPVLAISFVNIGLFVSVNNSVERSTNRFVSILKHQGVGNLFKEYNLLSAYSKDHPEIQSRRLEFLEKAWAQPPYLRRDSILVLNKLGEAYMKLGDAKRSLTFLELSSSLDPTNLYTYQFLRNSYSATGDGRALRTLASRMSANLETNARGSMDAGQLFAQLGEMDSARVCLERAYRLDSSDVFVVVNLGVFYMQSNALQRALPLLLRAVEMRPTYFVAHLNLTLTYLALGDVRSAMSELEVSKSLANTKTDRLQVQRIENAMRRGNKQ